MDQNQSIKRACPECGSEKYLFRGRKKIAEAGKPEVVEATYRCKECEHIWKERTPINEAR